jgi:hypothetical protein
LYELSWRRRPRERPGAVFGGVERRCDHNTITGTRSDGSRGRIVTADTRRAAWSRRDGLRVRDRAF